MRHSIAVVAVVALLGGSFLYAEESLGDAAAREKERRKDKPAPKVLTQDDLARAGGRSLSVTGEGDPEAAPANEDGSANPEGKPAATDAKATTAEDKEKDKDKEKDPADERADAQKAWHERWEKANAEVTRLEKEVQQLESDQNLYTNSTHVSRLEDARKKLAAAQDQLETLENERRRGGYRE